MALRRTPMPGADVQYVREYAQTDAGARLQRIFCGIPMRRLSESREIVAWVARLCAEKGG